MPPEPVPPTPQAPAARRTLQLLGLVLLLAGGAVVAQGLLARRTQAAELRSRADAAAVPTVAVVQPQPGAASATLELPARLEAQARAPIVARVSGYLKRWNVDIGAKVRAGQELAFIETPELDAQLEQAQAELVTARANAALSASTAARWQRLLASDAVSRQEVDEKTADLAARQSVVQALQASVERIHVQRRFARLVAPFDGVVTARNTDVGALVAAGGVGPELFVVSDIRRLRVYVNVPQALAAGMRPGVKARVRVPERPGQATTATVVGTAQAIQAASGSLLVQLALNNADGALMPGAFACVAFELPAAPGTLRIPPGALLFGKAGLRVAVVGPGDKVVIKRVTVARDLGHAVEIGSGLEPGDRVIDSPPDGLEAGETVRVLQPAAKAAS